MTYEVVFDVSERLPQVAVGVVAVAVLVVLLTVALWRGGVPVQRWKLVLGLGAGILATQFLVGRLWAFAIAVGVVGAVVFALEEAGKPDDDDDWRDRPRNPRALPYGVVGLLVGIVAMAVAASFGLPMVTAIDLERRLLAGEATVVEGPVMVEARGKSECLVVDAQRYCYSNGGAQAGYNTVRTILGGPFDTGDQVRLSIIDDQIVRIEVATGA